MAPITLSQIEIVDALLRVVPSGLPRGVFSNLFVQAGYKDLLSFAWALYQAREDFADTKTSHESVGAVFAFLLDDASRVENGES